MVRIHLIPRNGNKQKMVTIEGGSSVIDKCMSKAVSFFMNSGRVVGSFRTGIHVPSLAVTGYLSRAIGTGTRLCPDFHSLCFFLASTNTNIEM